MGNTNVRWFVCPGDKDTNEVISQRLPGQTTQVIRDNKGVERDVCECDWNGVIIPLIANHQEMGLEFRIFRIRGGGKMETFPFPKPGYQKKKRGRRAKRSGTRIVKASTGETVTF